jgi:hypothetical protein
MAVVLGMATTILLMRDPAGSPDHPSSLDPDSGSTAHDRRSRMAGLLSTDELSMMRERMVAGPFRFEGDFSRNSPGHWTEMRAAMSLDFGSARWDGPTRFNDGRVEAGAYTENDPPGDVRRMAHDMMSAAYAAAMVEDYEVARAITEEIRWQADRSNLDFSDRTLYPFDYYDDVNPLFMMALWAKDYLLAYDVTRAMGYPDDRVEQWFVDLATLCEQSVHANLADPFPSRKSDDYSDRADWVDREAGDIVWRFADGEPVHLPRISRYYQNRRSNQAGFVGLVGAVTDNQFFVDEFKRYARELVMFGHRSAETDGMHGDANRGTDSFPQLGFSYGLHAWEAILPAADMLARNGDTSVYDFSSSDGAKGAHGTAHAKSFETVLDTYIKWIDGAYPPQFTGSKDESGAVSIDVAGKERHRIQSRAYQDSIPREIVNDGNILLAANYFDRPDWEQVIMRVNTPSGFTLIPQQVGALTGWRADHRQRFLRSLSTDPYTEPGFVASRASGAPRARCDEGRYLHQRSPCVATLLASSQDQVTIPISDDRPCLWRDAGIPTNCKPDAPNRAATP